MAAPRIESYNHGRIVVDGKRFEQDIIIASNRIHLCWESYNHRQRLGRKYVAKLLRDEPEVLIMGMGAGSKLGLTKKAIALLEQAGIEWHALPTKHAARLYNKLREKKRVVAVFRLTS